MTAAAALAAAATGVSGPAAAHAASTVDCGYVDGYVAALQTEYRDDGTFRISITPTEAARAEGPSDWTGGSNPVTISMWHATQSCVPGLYGSLADSVWQQLQCHVWGGPIESATGPTYDLESWHDPLLYPGFWSYWDTHCLNYDDVADGGNVRYRDAPDDPYANIA